MVEAPVRDGIKNIYQLFVDVYQSQRVQLERIRALMSMPLYQGLPTEYHDFLNLDSDLCFPHFYEMKINHNVIKHTHTHAHQPEPKPEFCPSNEAITSGG